MPSGYSERLAKTLVIGGIVSLKKNLGSLERPLSEVCFPNEINLLRTLSRDNEVRIASAFDGQFVNRNCYF